jgi:hypothetical protein
MLKEKLPIFLVNSHLLHIPLLALTDGQADGQRNKYVNPQMGTNSVMEWGVPKWEFLSLPAHFHIKTPRMETGTVVSAGH